MKNGKHKKCTMFLVACTKIISIDNYPRLATIKKNFRFFTVKPYCLFITNTFIEVKIFRFLFMLLLSLFGCAAPSVKILV